MLSTLRCILGKWRTLYPIVLAASSQNRKFSTGRIAKTFQFESDDNAEMGKGKWGLTNRWREEIWIKKLMLLLLLLADSNLTISCREFQFLTHTVHGKHMDQNIFSDILELYVTKMLHFHYKYQIINFQFVWICTVFC